MIGSDDIGHAPVIVVPRHDLLDLAAFVTRFERPLGQNAVPEWLVGLLQMDAPAPVTRSEELRLAVRDLLRAGGYKPTGRGKPASEYLVRSAEQGTLSTINLAVDACNAVSLHSGLPVSVVDLGKATPPLRVGFGSKDDAYVFNSAGQVIDVTGLLCLFDDAGACANAVKDAQRTKTDADTWWTLSVVWGVTECRDQTARATAWYRDVLERTGAATREVSLEENRQGNST